MTFAPALRSSAKTDWRTPRAFYDELNIEFGFAVDVCATKENAMHNRRLTTNPGWV